MKNLSILIFLIQFTAAGYTQVVTSDPAFPITDMPATITFDATQGNGGLAGFTGDVYAHTGVITEHSASGSDWKYVKTDWGVNTPETKMTRIADDLYTLEIVPDIRNYYGVPEDEKILEMAFVFRSADSQLEGKDEDGLDIFVDVTEPGLNLSFYQPETTPVILASGESFVVEVYANDADSIALYVDDVLISHVSGNNLLDTIAPEGEQSGWVKAVAENTEAGIADSFSYVIRPPLNIEALPDGVRDGVNYMDDESVIFNLLAPAKEYIYVIGDFNNWEPDNDYFMSMTPDSLRFWLEVTGLTPEQEYIFQYLIDGEIRVGDPYSDKISDPWNDHYISEETYPGLITYPEGKTFGIASVLQTAQQAYEWEVDDFETTKTTDLVIYEMLLRDFTAKHSYEAVTDTLDYLEELGVNALELMPVNEFEGNSSWGYNPSFYFAPDKYYGPKDELKRLIDECHMRGIAVIIDMVLNHSYDQSPLVQMYFDGANPTSDNPWYNAQHNFANPDAQWGNDFNHESIYTQNFVDSVNSYWMSEYHVDGFRFDFTKGFSNTYHSGSDPWGSNYDGDRINILKRMMINIRSRNEDAIVILEHLSENAEEENLADFGMLMWGNANPNYAEASMGYHDNNKSDFSWISYQKRGWNNPHVLGYMESHDEERIMYKNVTWGNSAGWNYNIQDTSTALDRIRLISTFFYTIPGPKMIWQFGELGYDYSIDYNGRIGEKPVRWDYLDDWRRKYNYNFISALIDLRISHDVFETDNFDLNVSLAMKSISLFSDSMNVIIVGNFDIVAGEMQAGFVQPGPWYDYFNGTTLEVVDVDMMLSLEAGEYRIYTDVELETPDIGTGIDTDTGNNTNMLKGMVYPNPVTGNANLHFDLTEETTLNISIYNLLGSEMSVLRERQYPAGQQNLELKTNLLQAGIYFCVIRSGQHIEAVKFIKE
ncbi:MAG: alpha-amylase family glycosyl hydrolase [Bacteroidota bacterium]